MVHINGVDTVAAGRCRVRNRVGTRTWDVCTPIYLREGSEAHTLRQCISFIHCQFQDIKRIDLRCAPGFVECVHIGARLAIDLRAPRIRVAFTYSRALGVHRSGTDSLFHSHAQRIDTVATRRIRMFLFVITAGLDFLAAPYERLARNDSRRVMVMESLALDEDGCDDTIAVIDNTRERVAEQGVLRNLHAVPFDLAAEGNRLCPAQNRVNRQY